MTWSLKTFLGLSTDASLTNLNQMRDNLLALRLHTHSGTEGDGALLFGGAQFVQILPWYPASNVNWSTLTFDTGVATARLMVNTNELGNECTFPVALTPGTWDVSVWGWVSNSSGIASVYLDNSILGTLDFYAASGGTDGQRTFTGATVAGLTLPTTQSLRFVVTGKNASSSSYNCGLRFIQLNRTGA